MDRLTLFAAAFLAVFAAASPLRAQSGSLDTTFAPQIAGDLPSLARR